MKIFIPSVLLLALATAIGCDREASQGGPDLGSNSDGGRLDFGDPGGSEPIFSTPAGSVFAVEAQAPYGLVNEVNASFYAEEQPGFHREVQRSGACRLMRFQPAQCDLFCIGVCVERNVCKPFPPRISAGTLTFSGAKLPVTLIPQFQNYYYADPLVSGDLFDAGNPIAVSASGAEFGSFALTGAGVQALETAAVVDDEIKLEDDADYHFTWVPSGDPRARMRLTINANNRSHGAPYEAIIECDAQDTGSLTIAKELIAPFPDTFRWEICAGRDCPFSSALRYTQATGQAGSRRISLTVGSRRLFWVLHRAPK